MKIVLATGIYPPDIGGPATYVLHLAQELFAAGEDVTVVTYAAASYELRAASDDFSTSLEVTQGKREVTQGKREVIQGKREVTQGHAGTMQHGAWPVVRVSKRGIFLQRWMRYAKALRSVGADADIVYAFSSVSCGMPLWMARLERPRRVLRLGGDFFWERYTDRGGTLTLHAWYASSRWLHGMMNGLLRTFDHLVFSTAFQRALYEKRHHRLPHRSVIENALPPGIPIHHEAHMPFRLLFLGRLVAFKNLPSLLDALAQIPDATLTIAGDGPQENMLRGQCERLGIADRVTWAGCASGEAKQVLLASHDLLLLPSLTEISPNTALEARAAGLPVLLTDQTGLQGMLAEGMLLRPLRTPRDIAQAIEEARNSYELLAERSAMPLPDRTWERVAEEHRALFLGMV